MAGLAQRTRVARRERVALGRADADLSDVEGNLVLRIQCGEIDGKPLVGASLFLDADTPKQLRQLAARVALKLMTRETGPTAAGARRERVALAHAEAELSEIAGNPVLRIIMGDLAGKPLVGASVFIDADMPKQLRQLAAGVALRFAEKEARR